VITKADQQGRIVVAASAIPAGISVTRYRLDGTVDLQTVKVFGCASIGDQLRAMTIKGTNIILVGVICHQWAVVRLNDDFSEDWSFGPEGIRLLPSDHLKIPVSSYVVESSYKMPNAVDVDDMSRIVVVGTVGHSVPVGDVNGAQDRAVAVVAYSWDGQVVSQRVTNIQQPQVEHSNWESAEAVKIQGAKVVISEA
jgi:hypothetical protein